MLRFVAKLSGRRFLLRATVCGKTDRRQRRIIFPCNALQDSALELSNCDGIPQMRDAVRKKQIPRASHVAHAVPKFVQVNPILLSNGSILAVDEDDIEGQGSSLHMFP